MGKLSRFLGLTIGNLGNQRAEQQKIAEQAAEDERQFKQRLDYQKAAEALRLRNESIMNPTTRQGAAVQRGPGNWEFPQQTRMPRFDGDNLVGADWVDDGAVPAPPLKPIKVGNELVQPGYDGSVTSVFKPEPSAKEQAQTDYYKRGGNRSGSSRAPIGPDGMTEAQRRADARATKREERLERQGGGKDNTAAAQESWRDAYMEDTKLARDADLPTLTALLNSIGAPIPTQEEAMNGPANDDADHYTGAVRQRAIAAVEKYHQERRPGGKVRGSGEAPPPAKDAEAVPVPAELLAGATPGRKIIDDGGKEFRVNADGKTMSPIR